MDADHQTFGGKNKRWVHHQTVQNTQQIGKTAGLKYYINNVWYAWTFIKKMNVCKT